MTKSAYTVVDLGVLPGGAFSEATDINESGQVIGHSDIGGGITHAFLYSEGVIIDLTPQIGGTISYANGINSRGEIVGNWMPPNGQVMHGFLWTPKPWNGLAGTIQDIDPFGTFSSASDIDDSGRVFGHAEIKRAVVFHVFTLGNGKITDLGCEGHAVQGVNSSGQIVGSGSVDGKPHAFLLEYDQKKNAISAVTDLGVLSGHISSDAHAINNADPVQVAGRSDDVNDQNKTVRPFLFECGKSQNGVNPVISRTDLGSLTGWFAGASDINDLGQIVGFTNIQNWISHAFLWQPTSQNSTTGRMIDLNTLLPLGSGWELLAANAINNRGQIVGVGFYRNQRRAFLLTPDIAHINTMDRYTIEITTLLELLAKLPDPDPGPLPDMLKGLASYKIATLIQNKEGIQLQRAALNLVNSVASQESKRLEGEQHSMKK